MIRKNGVLLCFLTICSFVPRQAGFLLDKTQIRYSKKLYAAQLDASFRKQWRLPLF